MWIKAVCSRYSINTIITNFIKKVKTVHEKNLTNLLDKKRKVDGLKDNPNNTMWNLTSRILSKEEY